MSLHMEFFFIEGIPQTSVLGFFVLCHFCVHVVHLVYMYYSVLQYYSVHVHVVYNSKSQQFNYLQEKKVIEPEPSLKKRKNKVEPATNKKLKTEAYLAKKKQNVYKIAFLLNIFFFLLKYNLLSYLLVPVNVSEKSSKCLVLSLPPMSNPPKKQLMSNRVKSFYLLQNLYKI